MATESEWTFNAGPLGGNYVRHFDGFVVSYNPSTLSGGMFAGDGDGKETALIHKGKYYILNGDFREEYVALAPQGFEACLNFFREHGDLKSSWSDDASLAA